ncbi:MAG: 23S rRNA (uracil(1939)-C(5))-methyltransferase RlmD [Candidatus Marinimicrobia bacterium]|nr:23S rRNA (uracil(1939)-C(5))-methyltransferase RlmD [Candidatus Neomarinimicrobiota bacterium]
MGFGGKGFTKVDGLALFVRNSLPGQTLKVKIIKKRKGFAEAIPISVIEQSKHYVDPECPHFKYCGGCSLQNLSYSEQLEQKSRQVGEVLQHIGGVRGVNVEPIIAAPDVFYYRNKMEFSFSNKRWLTDEDEQKPKDFALGLHVPGNYEKVLDIDDCRLQSEVSNKILASVKKSAQEYKFKPYDNKNHSGNLRYLIIKQAANSDDLFVNIVTKYDEPMKLDKIVKKLIKDCPEITTVVNVINDSVASIAYGTKVNVMHGSGLFNEKIGSVHLELGPQEFLQTNTKAAELLYQKIIDFAELNEKMNVFDLYSGVGSISISIASQVQKVTGFELLPEAVDSAGRNAVSNGVLNCNFISGDMRELFRDVDYIRKVHGTPDVIILDPPRSGIHPSMPKRISNLKPKKVIYVSCNPASFARDVKLFDERGYKLVKLQPFDLFPHTPHIELVSLLVPKSD